MIKNIILPFELSKDLKNKIIFFVDNSDFKLWKTNNVSNTINRKFCSINKNNNVFLNEQITLLKKTLFFKLKIFKYINEEKLGNFIGVNKEGANVHIHTDEGFKNLFQVRLNFLVQKPEEGGMPIINGREYVVDENQCWFNNATLWNHGTTVVKGNKNRVVLSLGAYISPDDYERVNKEILNN